MSEWKGVAQNVQYFTESYVVENIKPKIPICGKMHSLMIHYYFTTILK